jgi:hypothetical protein
MDLKFPELNGGQEQGLNDAGVENFQGAVDTYLARECAQNSLDAHRPGSAKVFLRFERLSMSPSDIPGFDSLRSTLVSCSESESISKSPREREFFEEALRLAAQNEISVLKISDYGTTGLTGTDLERNSRWVALVKSTGITVKEDTAGGSFGIGKSSPFAASRFRTVFYGTRTENGQVALQGVSRLVTHKNQNGKLTQGTGFIGIYNANGGVGGDPIFIAQRDPSSIPEAFERTETGTDIWVIGYRSGDEWKDNLVSSIITNFWPSIHFGLIEFTVGEIEITKETLGNLILKYAGQEEFDADLYYPTILNQPVKKTLAHVGTCELYLFTANQDLPRRICMVRTSGMRIFDYAPRACRVPFSGLFACTDPAGNKLLRKMEPPRHDTWDPKRIEGQDGKQALDEIKLWIKDEVKKLNPLFTGNSFNESELAKYLADPDPQEPNDLPQDDKGQSNEQDLGPKPKKEFIPVTPMKAKPVSVSPGGEVGGGDGQGGGGAGPGNEGEGGQGLGDGKDGKSGHSDEPKPPHVQARCFSTGAAGTYELVLRTSENYSGSIAIHAIGEDGVTDPVNPVSAAIAGHGGAQLTISRKLIEDVNLVANVPTRIVVKLSTIERRALTATATI